jgi:hypothetical protein
MKKILILITFLLCIFLTKAQRFFYVETNNYTDKILREGLLKASQFITQSPLGSDYIIKTEVGFNTRFNALRLNMILEDSVTFKTVFQTNEEWSFITINKSSRLSIRMAIETFIDKNINQIITCAKDNYFDSRMKSLQPGKDKT